MKETDIQRDIMKAARAMGHKAYRMNSGGARARNGYVHLSEEGTPDLLIVMGHGLSLWVEVKRPGEKPTDIQQQRHRELRGMGHSVAVARSVQDFIEAIDEVEKALE